MRKISITILLVCFLLPLILPAQPKHYKQLQNNRYKGGVYAVWDSVVKRYSWNSPLRGNINLSSPQQINIPATSFINATQVFHLTKDINDETDAYPSNYQPQFNNQRYAVVNSVAYFAANDGFTGTEFWRSDGTTSGSYLVKDIEQGAGSSRITNVTAGNGKIYFSAVTVANGIQPWISDGTNAGTHILKDLNGYSNNEAPQMYTVVGNKVFFFLGNDQLWVTNGTDAGTKQISLPADNSAFQQPVALGSKLFFTTYSYYYGRQLWCSDGTGAGTHLVKQIGEDFNAGPQQLTPYNGKLYFSADDGQLNRRLWVSDGTNAGTYELNNNNNYLYPSSNGDGQMAIYNNTLFFIGYDLTDNIGLQLYKYSFDNNDGVILVKNITPGTDAKISPGQIVSYKNGIAFTVEGFDGSITLWTTKGGDSDTKPLKTFSPGDGYTLGDLCNASGNLFFAAFTQASGYELWKSDGTTNGTTLVSDIYVGTNNAFPYFISTLNASNILFSAKNRATGFELWKSDGTPAGTVLVKDINTNSSESAITTNKVIANTSDGILVPAYTQDYGNQLYYSDGTSAGTYLVNDTLSGTFRGSIYGMKTINDNVYFVVQKDDNGFSAIYRFQNSNKQLVKLFEAPNYDYGILNNYALADNGLLFFQMYNSGNNQNEIWRTDGTPTGSFIIKTNPSNEIVTVGNTAYFPGFDEKYGSELYKTDGTINGTKLVSDIYTGVNSSAPYSLINYKGALFFCAVDDDGQYYFWKTTGTSASTKKIAQIQLTASTPSYLDTSDYKNNNVYCISNGRLYINEKSVSKGNALWVSNGVTSGTKLLKTINPDYNSTSIDNLTDVNGVVYFSADDGINGNELWSSNGTVAGTKLIKNITLGSSGTNLSDFCAANNKLYFIANNTLWLSNGPGNKTMAVADAGLQGVSLIDNLIAAGNKLFFSGYTSQYGNEMYEGNVATQALALNAIVKNLNAKLKATISPNPVLNTAELELTNAKNAEVLLMDNTGKMLWQKININTIYIQIPMQQYPAGLYYVKIINEGESTTVKLIKQ